MHAFNFLSLHMSKGNASNYYDEIKYLLPAFFHYAIVTRDINILGIALGFLNSYIPDPHTAATQYGGIMMALA